MTTRREFLATAAAPLAAAAQTTPPKRIAAVVTEYYHNSHADVIVGKYLDLRFRQWGEGPSPAGSVLGEP